MTVVAGFVRNGVGGVAADQLASSEFTKEIGPTKVHKISEHVVAGYAGSYNMHKWVRRTLRRQSKKLEEAWTDNEKTLEILEDIWAVYHNSKPDKEACVLVVTPYQVVSLQSDGSVVPYEFYNSIGAGEMIARGAMFALSEPGYMLSEEEILTGAVEAAVHHNPYCGGEVDVLMVSE